MSATDAEAETLYDKLGRGAQADVKIIAAALLAAEKRGEERERARMEALAKHRLVQQAQLLICTVSGST